MTNKPGRPALSDEPTRWLHIRLPHSLKEWVRRMGGSPFAREVLAERKEDDEEEAGYGKKSTAD